MVYCSSVFIVLTQTDAAYGFRISTIWDHMFLNVWQMHFSGVVSIFQSSFWRIWRPNDSPYYVNLVKNCCVSFRGNAVYRMQEFAIHTHIVCARSAINFNFNKMSGLRKANIRKFMQKTMFHSWRSSKSNQTFNSASISFLNYGLELIFLPLWICEIKPT